MIKNAIIEDGYKPVTDTEWFSVTNTQAWALFKVVQTYNDKTIDDANYTSFKNYMLAALNYN